MKKQEPPKTQVKPQQPTKNLCAIAVVDNKGKVVKAFRASAWDNGNFAKLIIPRKNKDTGEMEKLILEFKGDALRRTMFAVAKHWKPFDPVEHRITIMDRKAAGIEDASETKVDPKARKR
jgi:hypothetical protein